MQTNDDRLLLDPEDEDGATVLDDGLSICDEDPRPRSQITSAQAAALRSDAKHYECFARSLLALTFLISVIVAAVRRYGNPDLLTARGGLGGRWDGDFWGAAARERENARRLKATLEYLIGTDVSHPDSLAPEANLGRPSGRSYTPQYRAALWIARDDPQRIDIPSVDGTMGEEDGAFKQRYALAVLYYATGGGDNRWLWKMRFLTGRHECNWNDEFTMKGFKDNLWFGVICDGEPDFEEGEADMWNGKRTVTGISLPPQNFMFGTLPQEVRHLKYLKVLHIQQEKNLMGSIPYEYGWLKHMTILALMDTSLTGKIPRQFAYLKKLELLLLQGNKLIADTTQDDFDFFEDMTSLTSIKLDDNPGIVGTLPSVMVSNLKNLKVLSLPNCGFYGPLPASMSMLKELMRLNLEENAFTGGVDAIQDLTNLGHLYLENNAFDGALSDVSFGKMENLVRLDLSNNKFGGSVPGDLFYLPKLEVVDMSSNNLAGLLPSAHFSDIRGPTNLKFLSVHTNNITGPIPASVGKLGNLTTLDLSINEFNGEIPSEISELKDLDILFLGRNDFDQASVPSWVRNMTHLTELSLKGASLTETIPEWLGELTDLKFLDLGENNLTETIPQSLGNLTELMVLILNKNRLKGELGLGQLSHLETLLIDDNDLTGNTNAMCAHRITHFIADCANETVGPVNLELSCPCCTLCCYDGNPACNDQEWLGNHAAMREFGYGDRVYWNFNDRGIITPLIDYNTLQQYGLIRT